MSIQSTFEIGMIGQDLALNHYLKNYFCLIDQNFQYYHKGSQGRRGEIDLIFEKKHILHFVEVKARSNQKFGLAQMQISATKLKTLYSAFQYFILKHKQYAEYNMQFDVAVINNSEIEIISNAYNFDGFSM